MAAPAPTARVTPGDLSGIFGNGFSSKITFALDPDIEFLEISVTPQGFNMPDDVDATTMFNVNRMTKDPAALYETTDAQAVVAYSKETEAQVRAILGSFTTITIKFPDGSTLADFGWLRSFVPGELTINGRPTATITIGFAGKDDAGAEQDPVKTDPA